MNFVKTINRILLLFVLLVSAVCSLAQTAFDNVKYLTVRDGMSDRIVNDILIDDQGFMWLATTNGLNRYDGSSFLIYNNDKKNPNKISGNNLEQLFQWENDQLLIHYKNQFEFVDIFSCETGVATKVAVQETVGLSNEVVAMSASSNKAFFLTRSKFANPKVYEWSAGEMNLLFELPKTLNLSYKSAQFLYDDKEQVFWLSSRKGDLWRFDRSGNLLKQFQLPPTGISLARDNFFKTVFYMAEDRSMWVSFEDRKGLYQLKPPYEELVLLESIPTDKSYGTATEDKHGRLIFSDINEDAIITTVYMMDKEGRVEDMSELVQLEKRLICFGGNDFDQSVFLGSYLGLHLVEQRQSRIKQFFTRKLKKGEGWGNPIRGITGDKKGKVFAVYTVLHWYELDLETDSLSQLVVRDSLTGELVELTCGGVIHEQDGYLWGYSCKDFGGKVYQINLATKKALAYDFETAIQGIGLTSDGKVWVGQGKDRGVGGSIIELNPNKKTFTPFQTDEGYNPFKESLPIFFKETKDGKLWVGTENGLFEIDRETKNIDVWKLNGGDHNVLSSNYIYVVHEDEDGRLWVGTKAGLNIIDRKTGKVEIYNQQDGLINNNVCGIIADRDSIYWLSTFNGLVSFDYKNKTFGSYTEDDGISHYEFNRYSFYKDYTGRIYFGSMNGFNAFRTDDLIQASNIPKVVLTKLLQFDAGAETLKEENVGLNYKDEVEIGVGVSYFELEFSLPKFTRSEENKYKIWLEGYEKEWEYLGNNGRKRYSRVPAGSYKLHILGADGRGNWSNKPRVINVKVLQPFYESLWFIGACVLGLVLMSLLYYRWHLYNLKKRNESLEREVLRRTETIRSQAAKLQEQDAVKSRIFAIVGHDLRKPAIAFRGITKKINYLIKKQDFERIQGLGKNLEENANALNKLTDNLLNWALTQRDVMPYQPQEIQILEVVNEVKEFFSTMLSDKQLQLQLDVSENDYVYADQNAFNTIIRNLIDNAIKYTPQGGNISIQSTSKETSTDIKVNDTGVGIPSHKIKGIFELQKNKSEAGTKGEKGTGLGLHLVNELVRLNKGEISVESEEGRGTSFLLSFPSVQGA